MNNEITCFGNGINCWLSAFSGLAKADKLDDIKQAGVVRIAILIVTHRLVYRSTNKKLAGYDADIANEIAKDLEVKLELRPTNPANRIPLLSAKKVDLIATPTSPLPKERAKQVDFCTYFATGQKFIARKAY